MEELYNLIVYFVRYYSGILTRTKLVKLIYLFEYNVVQTYGRQYSNVEFIRDKYGPNDMKIYEAVDYLNGINALQIKFTPTFGGWDRYKHLPGDIEVMDKYELPYMYCEIADDIISQTKDMSVKEIIAHAYNTPPIKEILNSEKSDKVFGRQIDMNKNEFRPFKASAEDLKAARARRMAVKDRGSDEEYAKHILEQYNEFAELRRRAELCLGKK